MSGLDCKNLSSTFPDRWYAGSAQIVAAHTAVIA